MTPRGEGPRGGSPEGMEYERWVGELFGDFEILRWEAEALREEMVVHVLSKSDSRVRNLWAAIDRAYAEAVDRLARQDDEIPTDVKIALRETFDAHVAEMQECFGRKFRLMQ